jgi:hypothetical protein
MPCTRVLSKNSFILWVNQNKIRTASAGSRTRVYCLEGNYPNRWTTNALIFTLFLYSYYYEGTHTSTYLVGHVLLSSCGASVSASAAAVDNLWSCPCDRAFSRPQTPSLTVTKHSGMAASTQHHVPPRSPLSLEEVKYNMWYKKVKWELRVYLKYNMW